MKDLKVLGAPDAVNVRYGVVDGDKLRVWATCAFTATADMPTDKATPEAVARAAGRLVNLLVIEATKALNPELAEAVEESAPKEVKPS